MDIIQAVFENGVFKPKSPVDLPNACEVELRVAVTPTSETRVDRLRAIYEVLSHRHETGESDLAARHDEHQP